MARGGAGAAGRADAPCCVAGCRAAKEIVPDGFTTATTIELQRRSTVFITTGCKALDDLLGGAARAARRPLPPQARAAGLVPTRWPRRTARRGRGVGLHHRDLRRVPHGQDADLPHAGGDLPGARRARANGALAAGC